MNSNRFNHATLAIAVLVLVSLTASRASAVLVVHFDPNVLSTQYGTLGQTPVPGLGDVTRWITDVRSPTPGGIAYDTWIDAEANADNPVNVPHAIQSTVWSFNGLVERMLSRRVNTLIGGGTPQGQQDGFGDAFDTNTLTTIVVGRIETGGTGVRNLFDLLENAANTGFGLRYDYATNLIEGYADQTVTSAVNLPVNDWFVATYAWNGPASTATLTVERLTGITSNTGAAPNTAISNVTELRIGTRSGGSSGPTRFFGNMGDLMIYNDVADHNGVALQLADDYLHSQGLVVDRGTGNLSFTKLGGDNLSNVVGYSINSQIGTLNPTGWLSITDNYDAGSPGPEQIDPHNDWMKTSAPSSRTQLAEEENEELGGAANGAAFVVGNPTDFGNVWRRYYKEDLTMTLHLHNGSTRKLTANFVGNNSQPFKYGDINFDGLVDEDDFYDVFLPHYGQNTSALLWGPERYEMGDMNEDGAVTYSDFFRLKSAILAANPAVGALNFNGLPVPEPNTGLLLTAGTAAVMLGRGRRKQNLVRS